MPIKRGEKSINRKISHFPFIRTNFGIGFGITKAECLFFNLHGVIFTLLAYFFHPENPENLRVCSQKMKETNPTNRGKYSKKDGKEINQQTRAAHQPCGEETPPLRSDGGGGQSQLPAGPRSQFKREHGKQLMGLSDQ